jgi:hypothetical protein
MKGRKEGKKEGRRKKLKTKQNITLKRKEAGLCGARL